MFSYQVTEGRILEALQSVQDNSYDAVFCDPPYGLGGKVNLREMLSYWAAGLEYETGPGFMAADWDVLPGPGTWAEIMRVTKPGGYLLAYGGTRTEDLLSVSIRLGGWERFDRAEWVYASGFAKSHNIAKATDSDTWAGYGTALEPAHEPVLCFRKPIDRTYANTALEWGSGGLNIDGCRVPITDGRKVARNNSAGANGWKNSSGGPNSAALNGEPAGSWPKNFIIDDSLEIEGLFPVDGKGSKARFFYSAKCSQAERHAGLEDLEGVQRDPTRNADQASMNGGEGNPYNRGAKEVKNNHPSVKPIAVNEYFSRLIVPPAALRSEAKLLVPYSGSGSEMIGAMFAGWQHVHGVEMVPRHAEIARHRLAYWIAEKERQDALNFQLEMFHNV